MTTATHTVSQRLTSARGNTYVTLTCSCGQWEDEVLLLLAGLGEVTDKAHEHHPQATLASTH